MKKNRSRPSFAWFVLFIVILLVSAREFVLATRSAAATEAFSSKVKNSTLAGSAVTFADIIDEFGKPIHFVSWKGQLDDYHLYIYPLANSEYKVLFNSDLGVCSIEITQYARGKSQLTIVEYKPQMVADAKSSL